MNKSHLQFLVCPTCNNALQLIEEQGYTEDHVESGLLRCHPCKKEFPIIRSIPRFVDIENYASGFGFQWIKHAKTQYDSHSGTNLSERRFFEETKCYLEDFKNNNLSKIDDSLKSLSIVSDIYSKY